MDMRDDTDLFCDLACRWETGYWRSMDIMHDRAGYYICWGCLVWVPAVYTSPAMYLTLHGIDTLSAPVALAIAAAGIAAVYINYDSDKQRQVKPFAQNGLYMNSLEPAGASTPMLVDTLFVLEIPAAFACSHAYLWHLLLLVHPARSLAHTSVILQMIVGTDFCSCWYGDDHVTEYMKIANSEACLPLHALCGMSLQLSKHSHG